MRIALSGAVWPKRSARTRRVRFALPMPTGFALLIAILVAMVALFTTLIIVVLICLQLVYPNGYPDPFAPYDDLWPGAPDTLLAAHLCKITPPTPTMPEAICQRNLDSGSFKQVTVVAKYGKIHSIVFLVRQLQVVDLVKRWGQPDKVERSPQQYTLSWQAGVEAYVRCDRQFTYQLGVDLVLFKASV